MHAVCWKQRVVASMTLSQCAESVEDEAHVDEIVQKLVVMMQDRLSLRRTCRYSKKRFGHPGCNHLEQDEHPRVRYAVLHALGQTSTDQAPYVQDWCARVLNDLHQTS
eukprot:4140970-Amphidinium_carterae.2